MRQNQSQVLNVSVFRAHSLNPGDTHWDSQSLYSTRSALCLESGERFESLMRTHEEAF